MRSFHNTKMAIVIKKIVGLLLVFFTERKKREQKRDRWRDRQTDRQPDKQTHKLSYS